MTNLKILSGIVVSAIGLTWMTGCGKSSEARGQEYLSKGDQLADKGQYSEASLNYRKALQFNPNWGEAYYRLGTSERKQNNIASAFQAFYRATELLPNNDRAKIEFANLSLERYLADSRHHPELLDHLDRISRQLMASNPESFDAVRLKGYVEMLRGDSRGALRLFEQAARARRNDAEILLALSECLFREGQSAEAERVGLELIKDQPHYGPIYDQLYNQYLSAKSPADAEQILRRKVSNNPEDLSYRLDLAAHYAKFHNDGQVKQELAALQGMSARHTDARLRLGDFYAKLGNLSDAVDQYRQGAAAGGSTQLLYQKRLVEALLTQGQDGEAGKVVDAMLAAHPDDPEVRIKHALVLLASRRRDSVESAATELTNLAKSLPNDANVLYYLGRAHLALGRLGEANVAFLEALRRRNDSAPVRMGLAEIALRMGASKEAVRYAEETLAEQPRHVQARLIHAMGMTNLGEYATAEKELSRLLADQPGLPEAELQMGVVYIALKRFQDAERLFTANRNKFGDDLRPLEGLVETYAFQNQFSRAYSVLQERLVNAPNSVQLRLLLANVATQAGQNDLATQQYRQILTANPGHLESYVRLAEMFSRQQDYTQAIAELERARSVAPADAKVAGLLGFAQERGGQLEAAKASYHKCLELQPGNAAVENNLAFLIAETGGDLEEAQRLAEQAAKRGPKNPTYVDTLGWVYLKRNMTGSALRIFQSLAEDHPDDATFRYHLAMSLLQSGDRSKAKTELEKALGQQPNREYQAKIREAISRLS